MKTNFSFLSMLIIAFGCLFLAAPALVDRKDQRRKLDRTPTPMNDLYEKALSDRSLYYDENGIPTYDKDVMTVKRLNKLRASKIYYDQKGIPTTAASRASKPYYPHHVIDALKEEESSFRIIFQLTLARILLVVGVAFAFSSVYDHLSTYLPEMKENLANEQDYHYYSDGHSVGSGSSIESMSPSIMEIMELGEADSEEDEDEEVDYDTNDDGSASLMSAARSFSSIFTSFFDADPKQQKRKKSTTARTSSPSQKHHHRSRRSSSHRDDKSKHRHSKKNSKREESGDEVSSQDGQFINQSSRSRKRSSPSRHHRHHKQGTNSERPSKGSSSYYPHHEEVSQDDVSSCDAVSSIDAVSQIPVVGSTTYSSSSESSQGSGSRSSSCYDACSEETVCVRNKEEEKRQHRRKHLHRDRDHKTRPRRVRSY